MITVAIADDHKMFREGVVALFKSDKDIYFIGEAADGLQTLSLIKKKEPEVLLLDIEMPKMDGLETLKAIKHLKVKTKVLILSMHKSPQFIKNSFAAGAAGYLQKDAGKELLTEAILSIAKTGTFYSKETSKLLIDGIRNKTTKALISKREQEIIRLIADGLTTKKIATTLFISPFTVETHRQNILLKLGLKNSAELVKYAVQKNLL